MRTSGPERRGGDPRGDAGPGRRWLGVHLPAFRLERCGYDADALAALVDHQRGAVRVVACTPCATQAGVRVGMGVEEARVVAPGLCYAWVELEAEAEDRAELVAAFERFSDRVRPVGSASLVLDISRTAGVQGGEAGVVERVHALCELLGHRAQIAITDDPRAAVGLARRGPRSQIVPAGEMADALAPLSPALLGAPDRICDELRAIGVRTLGQLARLDRASVAGRFGAEGAELAGLARGQPRALDQTPLPPLAPPLPSCETELHAVTDIGQLQQQLPALVGRLVAALAEQDLAVVRLRCALHLERGAPVWTSIRSARPTQSVPALCSLVRNRLAQVRVHAPIERIGLHVDEAEPARGWQPGLADRACAREALPDLLARLQDGLGDAALFYAEPVDSWCPERSWRARQVEASLSLVSSSGGRGVDPVVALHASPYPGRSVAPPAQLLDPPLDVQVRVEAGRPVALQLGTTWEAIHQAWGPTQLSGAWWRGPHAWARSYWTVELGRARVGWLYQSAERWFLHGWY